jgi:hypothetical protein
MAVFWVVASCSLVEVYRRFSGTCLLLSLLLLGFDSRQGQRVLLLTSASRPALGPTQSPVRWVPGVLSPGVKRGWSVTLTAHPHLVPRSIMCKSYTSSPPSATMACSGTSLSEYITRSAPSYSSFLSPVFAPIACGVVFFFLPPSSLVHWSSSLLLKLATTSPRCQRCQPPEVSSEIP